MFFIIKFFYWIGLNIHNFKNIDVILVKKFSHKEYKGFSQLLQHTSKKLRKSS